MFKNRLLTNNNVINLVPKNTLIRLNNWILSLFFVKFSIIKVYSILKVQNYNKWKNRIEINVY